MSLKPEVYNAITTDATLISLMGGRVYWVGKPTLTDTFPIIVYKELDVNGTYSFGLTQSAEDVTFQLDIYTDVGKVLDMDAIHSRLKIVMNGLCYRELSGAEDIDESISKVVKATRWVKNSVDNF